MEELANECTYSSRGSLDASSVETRSVEVRMETFSCSDLRAPGVVWRVWRSCRLGVRESGNKRRHRLRGVISPKTLSASTFLGKMRRTTLAWARLAR